MRFPFPSLTRHLLSLSFLLISSLGAAPREWTDQASGRKITAEFIAVLGDQVTLSINGKEYKMPVAKLSAEDQAYLKIVGDTSSTPVDLEPTAPAKTDAAKAPAPASKVMGPIDAEGSHYYYYVPASLKDGRKAPLIFYTGSGGGSADKVKAMAEGAEICGWIVACSVELKNSMPDAEYPKQTDRCLKSLFATLPIDPEQVYFTGNSGGARVAFTNSKRVNSAGVLAVIAGADDGELSRSKRFFIISGSTDYNRYDTATSYAEVRKSAAYRMHPGPHEDGPQWFLTEGMVWLQAAWNAKDPKPSPVRADFETAAMDWIERLKVKTPYRAAWWVKFFQTQGIGAEHKAKLAALDAELSKEPANLAYIKGVSDIEDFAYDVLSKESKYSAMEHTTPEIQRKADVLIAAHKDTPWFNEVTANLRNPTSGKKK
jgi:hypothetical protein